MDSRTIIAVMLSLGIWYGWLAMFPPPPPPEVPEEGEPVAAAVDTPPPVVEKAPTRRPSEDVDVSLCGLEAKLATGTGGLHSLQLPEHRDRFEIVPLYMYILSGMGEPWKPYGEEPGPAVVGTDNAEVWTAGMGPVDGAPYTEVVTNEPGHVVTRGVGIGGIEVTRTFKSSGNAPCITEVDVTWRNTGSSEYAGSVWVASHDLASDAANRYSAPMRTTAFVDGDLVYHEPGEDTAIELEGPVGWLGLSDTYFGTFMVPAGGAAGTAAFTRLPGDEDDLLGVTWSSQQRLAPGSSVTANFKMYSGPKDLGLLGEVSEDLADAVDLGFFAPFAYPMLIFLRGLFTVVGDWALAIISLVFIIKVAFFRMTQNQYTSMQKMQAIQPQMNEIRETYKDNPQEQQAKTMALFAEHGVSPLGGCLPMFLQMPVWFALYSVLWSSVELYHTQFAYLRDLTSADPYMILPAIVMVLMIAQQRLMPASPNMDPTQQRMMKLMPVVFGFLFFALPSGLVVYIFVNMLLSILQQWYIKRSFDGAAPQPAAKGA